MDHSPLRSALTAGQSEYGDFRAKATLAIQCYPGQSIAHLALQIAPSSLGFDSEPFHGKDAPANGPLRITTGAQAAVDHRVSGVWTDAGTFQVGIFFSISTALTREELAYWENDASQGQSLTLELSPATPGGLPLTATFTLPRDNQGLKRVIQPCLK